MGKISNYDKLIILTPLEKVINFVMDVHHVKKHNLSKHECCACSCILALFPLLMGKFSKFDRFIILTPLEKAIKLSWIYIM